MTTNSQGQEKETPLFEGPLLPTRPTDPVVGFCLALLMPGLGHAYLGQRGKAVLFFLVITLLFLASGLMGNFHNYSLLETRLVVEGGTGVYATGLKEFMHCYPVSFVFHLGNGLLTVVASLVTFVLPKEALFGYYYETGVAYASVTGLLNLLLAYDAFELSLLGNRALKKLKQEGK